MTSGVAMEMLAVVTIGNVADSRTWKNTCKCMSTERMVVPQSGYVKKKKNPFYFIVAQFHVI